ncbi:MAG: T9SS C-terminal target domain-containing protein [Bacteroidetes bacterium]|nr:MAG: T9SS C-terminal target domain-containing protein [Bacteroidota bacterium]
MKKHLHTTCKHSVIFFCMIWSFGINGQDTLHVTNNIYVGPGETMEIPEGTVVYFHDYYHITVEGTLTATGTEESPVTFTAADTTNIFNTHIAEGGWNGIRFLGNDEIKNDNISLLEHCIFEFSKASKNDFHNGGAVCVAGPVNISIENCTFRHNYAYRKGGAIYIEGNNSIITKSSFYKNTASNEESELWTYGGAIFMTSGRPQVSWSHFEQNYASGIGGALAVESADPNVFNNIIINNNSPLGGGIGVLRATGANVFSNNLIAYNYSMFFGGGIAFVEASGVFANNTILHNYAGYGGGLYFNEMSKPVFYNCIIRSNTVHADSVNQVFIWDALSAPDFYNCNIEGGLEAFDGGGYGDDYLGVYQDNIDEVPLFEDPANMDFSLSDGSPGIDSGYENSHELDIFPLDLAGNARFSGIRIDMGAFEFQDPYSYFELTISTEGNGTTDPGIGTHIFQEGTLINITPMPDEQWYFDHWVAPWGNIQDNLLEFELLEDTQITAVFFQGTTTSDLYFSSWNLFPNPVNDLLHIEIPESFCAPYEVFITDLNGEKIFSGNFESRQFTLPLRFDGIAPGVYFVYFVNESGKQVFRIIKI